VDSDWFHFPVGLAPALQACNKWVFANSSKSGPNMPETRNWMERRQSTANGATPLAEGNGKPNRRAKSGENPHFGGSKGRSTGNSHYCANHHISGQL
jgi:hypothetical protein